MTKFLSLLKMCLPLFAFLGVVILASSSSLANNNISSSSPSVHGKKSTYSFFGIKVSDTTTMKMTSSGIIIEREVKSNVNNIVPTVDVVVGVCPSEIVSLPDTCSSLAEETDIFINFKTSSTTPPKSSSFVKGTIFNTFDVEMMMDPTGDGTSRILPFGLSSTWFQYGLDFVVWSIHTNMKSSIVGMMTRRRGIGNRSNRKKLNKKLREASSLTQKFKKVVKVKKQPPTANSPTTGTTTTTTSSHTVIPTDTMTTMTTTMMKKKKSVSFSTTVTTIPVPPVVVRSTKKSEDSTTVKDEVVATTPVVVNSKKSEDYIPCRVCRDMAIERRRVKKAAQAAAAATRRTAIKEVVAPTTATPAVAATTRGELKYFQARRNRWEAESQPIPSTVVAVPQEEDKPKEVPDDVAFRSIRFQYIMRHIFSQRILEDKLGKMLYPLAKSFLSKIKKEVAAKKKMEPQKEVKKVEVFGFFPSLGPSIPEQVDRICSRLATITNKSDFDSEAKKLKVEHHPDRIHNRFNSESTKIFQRLEDKIMELEHKQKFNVSIPIDQRLRDARSKLKEPTSCYIVGYSLEETTDIVKWEHQKSVVVNALNRKFRISMIKK